MVKRLESLTDEQKEILKALPSHRDEGMTLEEIRDVLDTEDYALPVAEMRKEMGGLIKYGAVRSTRDKKYYLSRGIGSGYRNQSKLLGKSNPVRDLIKFYQRITGGIFVLTGFFFLYQNTRISGALISNGVVDTGSILSIIAFIIGMVLLFISSKK